MAKKKLTLEEKIEEAIVKDIPYEVPENWVWTTLGTLCGKVQYGYTEKASVEKVGPHFLRITDIQDNGVDWRTVPYCVIEDKDFEKYKLDKGDIVIARTGATTGKNYIINDEVESVFASYLIRMKIKECIYNKFVSFYMYSDLYWNQIIEERKGSAQPGVNAQKLGNLIIPVPPLKEQQRIVDKIENLFEKLDKAKELIEEARDDFENRKKTLIASGVSGELINKKFNNEVCINDVIVEINSGFACSKQHEVGKDEEGAYPHLRPNNVGYYNMFNFDKIVYIPKEKVQEGKEVIKRGDIIFNNTNSTELVGRAVVATEDMNVAFSNHLTKIIVDKNKVLPEWVTYSINALWGKGFFTQICKQWVGQSGVNQNVLKNEVTITLPSLEEQKEIVRILDNLLKEESKIEELTALEEQIELIKKAILAKAFRGQLGTNCKEDESALELLKVILSKR